MTENAGVPRNTENSTRMRNRVTFGARGKRRLERDGRERARLPGAREQVVQVMVQVPAGNNMLAYSYGSHIRICMECLIGSSVTGARTERLEQKRSAYQMEMAPPSDHLRACACSTASSPRTSLTSAYE